MGFPWAFRPESLEDYYNGKGGTECDQLTHEYGHGMLRTGPAQGSFVGQQATGSTVDRMLKHLH